MTSKFLFKVLLFSQFCLFLMFFSAGFYLIAMGNSAKTDPGLLNSFKRSGLISLLVSPLWLIPLLGLRRMMRWGWWMGLVVNLVCCALMTWALTYHEYQIDWAAMSIPALFLVATFLHVLNLPRSWQPKTGHADTLPFKRAV